MPADLHTLPTSARDLMGAHGADRAVIVWRPGSRLARQELFGASPEDVVRALCRETQAAPLALEFERDDRAPGFHSWLVVDGLRIGKLGAEDAAGEPLGITAAGALGVACRALANRGWRPAPQPRHLTGAAA